MNDYVCPGCGDTNNEDNLVPIDGKFTIEVGDYNRYQEDVKIYACKVCSCLQVNNWHFRHKEAAAGN